MIKKRILVIADDMSVYRSVRACMENDSTDVCCINDPARILEIFMKQEYCLVIADFPLLKMDGLKVIRTMKGIRRTPILIVTRICLYTKSPPKGGLFHVLGQKKEDKRMDLNSLAPLMVKHGAVIRAIPESIREVFEKRHINDYPNGEVKYLPEYKREMIVTYKHPTLGGKFALTFAKHTNNDVAFAKWLFFDSLEEVAGYLAELEEDNQ